jgi:hypothetical protein
MEGGALRDLDEVDEADDERERKDEELGAYERFAREKARSRLLRMVAALSGSSTAARGCLFTP